MSDSALDPRRIAEIELERKKEDFSASLEQLEAKISAKSSPAEFLREHAPELLFGVFLCGVGFGVGRNRRTSWRK